MLDGDWVESKDQSFAGIRLVQTGNIGEGTYIDKPNHAKFIDEEAFLRLNCTEIFEGDVLVSRLPTPVGRSCALPKSSTRMITAVDCTIMRFNKDQCIPEYFVYFSMSPNYLTQVSKHIVGSTRVRISRKNLETVMIPLPPLEIQKQIAKTLDTASELLAMRKQQLAELDRLIKSVFYYMFGDLEENEKGWEPVKLGSVLKESPQNGLYKPSSAYTNETNGTPILRIDSFYNGKLAQPIILKRLICTQKEIDLYLLCENDIVINRVNSMEYLGKCAHITGLLESTVFESNMMRLKTNEDKINPIYLIKVLCTSYIYNQILSHAKKAVNQASINQKDVQDFNILIPPLLLQTQFAFLVTKIEEQKALVQKSIDETQTLFDSLMSQYFE